MERADLFVAVPNDHRVRRIEDGIDAGRSSARDGIEFEQPRVAARWAQRVTPEMLVERVPY